MNDKENQKRKKNLRIARAIKAIVDDPNAIEGERESARDRLTAFAEKWNFSEDELNGVSYGNMYEREWKINIITYLGLLGIANAYAVFNDINTGLITNNNTVKIIGSKVDTEEILNLFERLDWLVEDRFASYSSRSRLSHHPQGRKIWGEVVGMRLAAILDEYAKAWLRKKQQQPVEDIVKIETDSQLPATIGPQEHEIADHIQQYLTPKQEVVEVDEEAVAPPPPPPPSPPQQQDSTPPYELDMYDLAAIFAIAEECKNALGFGDPNDQG